MELRPLGFGEIFDRAITLYVRNFWPFLAIVLVLILPLAVFQYFLDSSQSAQIADALRILTHPNATPPALSNLFASPADVVAIVVFMIVYLALWPFVFVAVAIGVARIYRGRPVEFAACYRSVLPRWGSILLTQLIAIVVFVLWYAAFFVLFLGAVVVATLLAQVSLPLGIVGFVVALVLVIALLLVLALMLIALAFAMNAVVIEHARPAEAIVSGFGRIFARQELPRALVFALAAFAVIFGASVVVSMVAFAALLAHAIALEVVISSLMRAAFAPFSIVLIAVYYFDVRIRREGYDLEAELERMTEAPSLA
jgi:hypothetical protein